MPGTNAGTGEPIWFTCAAKRRERLYERIAKAGGHVVHRTGREKKTTSQIGVRHGQISREYMCSCGYKGWSRHNGLLRLPLQEKRE